MRQGMWLGALSIIGAGLLAASLHRVIGIDHDVAYFLETGALLADGRVLYDDIVDFNTPAAARLGWVSVLLAKGLGTPADLTHKAFLIVLLALASGLALAMLGGSRMRAVRGWAVLAFGLPVVLLLGTAELGRREHLLFAGILPWALAVVLSGGGVDLPRARALRIAAGLLAAGALFLKPHFVLIGAALGVVDLVRAGGRPGRCLLETWTAGAGTLALYGGFLAINPAYLTEMVPFSLDTYARYRFDTGRVVAWFFGPEHLAYFSAVLIASLLVLRRGDRLGITALAAGLAVATSAGAAAVLQGMGFRYHRLPVDLLAMTVSVAVVAAVLARPIARRWLTLVGLALALATLWVNTYRIQSEIRINGLRAEHAAHPLVQALRPERQDAPILVVSPAVSPAVTLTFLQTGWAGATISHFPIAALIEIDGVTAISDPPPPEVQARHAAWFRARMLKSFEASLPEIVAIDVSPIPIFFERDGIDILRWLRADPGFDAAWRRARLVPAGSPIDLNGFKFQIYRAIPRP